MPDKDLTRIHTELLEALPQAIRRALLSYEEFASHQSDHVPPGDDEPKAYTAHHTGSKAALGHLEALLKLARTSLAEYQLAHPPAPAEGADSLQELPRLIEEAQARLDSIQGADDDSVG